MKFTTQIDLFEALKEPGRLTTAEGSPTILQLPLLPEGEFEHPRYGKLEFSPERFARMKANFDSQALGFVPSLNLDHASQNPYAAECRAMGWFKDLVYVPGQGLDFVVELTPAGLQAIEAKEYRYISAEPADEWTTPTGVKLEDVVVGAALTNWPYFSQMRGLFDNKAACFDTRGAASFGVRESADPPSLSTLTAQFSTAIQSYRMGDDLSFSEIRERICEAVRLEMQYRPGYAYVEEVYPEFFILELYGYETDEARHYRRGYALSADGTIALAPLSEAVEVEEVWVEVARQAFSAARVAAYKLRQEPPAERTAGDPANGERRMSTTETTQKTWWQRLAARFNQPETATEEEVVAAIEAAAPAPAGEPEKPAVPDTTSTDEAATLSVRMVALEARVTQAEANAQAAFAAQQAAQAELASANANALIQEYQKAGKVTAAMLEGENGQRIRDLAAKDPETFKLAFSRPVVDLGSYGQLPRGDAAGDAETLVGLAAQIQQADGCTFDVAVVRARDQRPDLYQKYRAAQPGQKGAN